MMSAKGDCPQSPLHETHRGVSWGFAWETKILAFPGWCLGQGRPARSGSLGCWEWGPASHAQASSRGQSRSAGTGERESSCDLRNKIRLQCDQRAERERKDLT